ncbi:hypothetical protein SF83666_a42280 (plasmid) [Sinorhizobium fredii CCBAU 83666]|nr:hypothetical protein SF83666_a42280 [Sinorhizobium fredii CCBAU 83666]
MKRSEETFATMESHIHRLTDVRSTCSVTKDMKCLQSAIHCGRTLQVRETKAWT